jgi:hypothetical protein
MEEKLAQSGRVAMSHVQDQFSYTRGGGPWLGAARHWVQRKRRNGDRIEWSSTTPLDPPMTMRDLENAVEEVAQACYDHLVYGDAMFRWFAYLPPEIRQGSAPFQIFEISFDLKKREFNLVRESEGKTERLVIREYWTKNKDSREWEVVHAVDLTDDPKFAHNDNDFGGG